MSRRGCRPQVVHAEERDAAVVHAEDMRGHVLCFAGFREAKVILEAEGFSEVAAGAEAHQVDHMRADPGHGAAVGGALVPPRSAVADLVRFLRIELVDLAQFTGLHDLPESEIRGEKRIGYIVVSLPLELDSALRMRSRSAISVAMGFSAMT